MLFEIKRENWELVVFGFQSKVDVELFAQLETNICERKNLLNQKSNTFAHTGQVELMILSYKGMQEMSKVDILETLNAINISKKNVKL